MKKLKRGFSKTRLYAIYYRMLDRCYKDYKSSKNYKQKGITVCEEWRSSYFNFYEWAMSHGYADNLTIDRIDSTKNYCPENCRWVTYKVQNNNKSTNVYFEYNGQKKTMKEWAETLGMCYGTIQSRYARFGNNPEKIFCTDDYGVAYAEYNGKRLSLKEWEKITGIPRDTLYKRIVKNKWGVEKALTTPLGETVGKQGMKKVKCIETGIVYESIAEAGRQIKRQESNIKACCVNKRKTCGGYHWEWY